MLLPVNFVPVMEDMIGDIMLPAIILLALTALLPGCYHGKLGLTLLFPAFHVVLIWWQSYQLDILLTRCI